MMRHVIAEACQSVAVTDGVLCPSALMFRGFNSRQGNWHRRANLVPAMDEGNEVIQIQNVNSSGVVL